RQARDDDRPVHPVVAMAVAGKTVEIERTRRILAVERELQGVRRAGAGRALGVEAGRVEAGRDARPEARRELAIEPGDEAAEIVGEAVAVAVARDRAERPHAATPRSPQWLDIAGALAGVGGVDLQRLIGAAARQACTAAATTSATGLDLEAVHEQLRALHRDRAEARVVLAGERVEDRRELCRGQV